MGNHLEKGKSSNEITMKHLDLPGLFCLSLSIVWTGLPDAVPTACEQAASAPGGSPWIAVYSNTCTSAHLTEPKQITPLVSINQAEATGPYDSREKVSPRTDSYLDPYVVLSFLAGVI